MAEDRRGLLPALALPLAAGGLAAYLTGTAFGSYRLLRLPPLAPPGWAFPVVWTALYLLMGLASSRLWQSADPARWEALALYGAGLGLGFCWPLVFFRWGWWLAALALAVGLAVTAAALCRRAWAVDRMAGGLLLPYAVWCQYACYLNLGVYLLNPMA